MDETKNDAKLERAFQELVGLTHHYFKYFDFNVLILFCDEPKWSGTEEQNTQWRIWIETDWRLRDAFEIVAYNKDEDDRIFRELTRIRGKKITEFKRTGLNAQIIFEGGFSLEIIIQPEAQGRWELRRSDGYRINIDRLSITEVLRSRQMTRLWHHMSPKVVLVIMIVVLFFLLVLMASPGFQNRKAVDQALIAWTKDQTAENERAVRFERRKLDGSSMSWVASLF